MAKNLMESIAEDEQSLAANTRSETLTEENEDGIEPERPERDDTEDGRSSATETQSGDARTEGNGRRGRRNGTSGRASGKSPQGESSTSREDGEAPSRDSSGTRKDASAPREDAQGSSGVLDEDESPPTPGDHAAWAKLRREKRELEAQLKLAKGIPAVATSVATVTPPAAVKPEVKATDAEPDRATQPEAWRDWKDKQLESKYAAIEERLATESRQKEEVKIYSEAINEYNQIRDKYIAKNPDYIPAFTHSFDAYSKSIKMTRPDLTQKQITGMIDREMLQFAGLCVSKGLNPAEELYDLAIERFGYAPKAAEAVADDVEQENKAPDGVRPKETPRPNLRTIANNRKRAASPLVGGGQGGKGQLTKAAAADMTLGEMMELEPSDWAELERHGGA